MSNLNVAQPTVQEPADRDTDNVRHNNHENGQLPGVYIGKIKAR